MKIVCASTSCKYSSKNEDSRNVIFISFPNDDTSTVWAHNCGRPDLLMKSNEELHKNYYICANHIEDRYFINKTNQIILVQGAVPTLFRLTNDSSQQYEPTNLKEQYSSDNVIETLHLDNCINVNSTCTEYIDTEVDYQSAMYNSNLQDSSTHIDDMRHDERIEHMDNNFCSVNINIDQFNDMTIKFTQLCRICGQGSPGGLDIFSEKATEIHIIEKIHLHLSIVIEKEDSMPQKICPDCYEKLQIAHSLFITCLRTDIKLRKYLNLPSKYIHEDRFRDLISLYELEINDESCIDATVEELPISQNKEKNDPSINETFNEDIKKNKNTNISTQIIISHGSPSVIQCTEGTLVSSKLDNRFKFVLQQDLNNLIFQPLQSMQDVTNNTDNSIIQSGDLIVHKDNQQLINFNNTDDNNGNDKIQNQCNAITANSFQVNENIFEDEKSPGDNNKNLHQDRCNLKHPDVEKCNNETNGNNNMYINEDGLELDLMKKNEHETGVEQQEQLIEQHHRHCGYCPESFTNRKLLQIHMVEKHSGQQILFKCGLCDKVYEKWSSLDVHEATHRQDKPYLCDLCGKSFKHSNNLRGHKRTHLDITKKKRHVCEICSNAFRSRFHLKEHMNQHNGNKPYVCEQCGKAFSKRIQLRQHRLSHGLNKYACPICGATFNRRGNMNTHVKRHSNNDGMYTCSVCECRCKSMSELKSHRKQHTDSDIVESIKKKCNDKPLWECNVCKRVFPKRGALLNHQRTHDGTQVRVECDKCGKKLSSKSSLKYHIKSIHTFERPHMCQFCGDVFISKDARLIHERIHTGERPYSCKLCNMQYRCSSHLSQHMKVHSEIRPYVCRYCNKSFARKGSMTVHERIHTGVKPFVCDICDKTFSQKHDMVKHSRIHNVKIFRCEDCNQVFNSKTDIYQHFENFHKSNSSIDLSTTATSTSSVNNIDNLPDNFHTYSLDVSSSSQSNNEESSRLS